MKSNRVSSLLMGIGLLLMAGALFLFMYNQAIQKKADESAAAVLEQLDIQMGTDTAAAEETENGTSAEAKTGTETETEDAEEESVPLYQLNPNIEMPVMEVDGYDYIGVLEIPAINLRLPVMAEWDYERLRIAPCRFTGSLYQDDLIVCAHNFQGFFRELKTLQTEDLVLFTDAEGNLFRFRVAEIEVLEPTDIEEMTSGEWDLTLFTCTVGGAYRVTVRCERTSP